MARPEWKPTATQRRKVAIAAGGGMPHEHIAIALGVNRTTLYKHCAHELTIGAYEKRLEVLEALQRAGKKGSVSAAKAYLLIEPGVTAPPEPVEKPEVTAKPAPRGKKEIARAEAATAHVGTDWGGLLDGEPVGPVQ